MLDDKKREQKVTPTGEARWSHLITPKPPFTDSKTGKEKGEKKYQIDLVFDPKDPLWNTWVKNLSEAVKKVGTQSPLKKEFDVNDEPTGRYYVTFKTSDKFKPNVFDKHGRPMTDVKIGNGSKVKVSYMENEYEAFGGGINLYLNAVQVIELVEFGTYTADSYGFEVVPIDDEFSSELEAF